tara:strand:+ start:553 stop:903 length:351 start_codon:yes stop_codon:yes gene_type:complete
MPIIKNKSRKFIFKNNLKMRGKSKNELLKESIFMMIFGTFLFLIIYIIPQKKEFFNSFKNNILNILNNLLEILFYSLEILIVLFISLITLFSLFLIVGSINRMIKIIKSKSRKIIR